MDLSWAAVAVAGLLTVAGMVCGGFVSRMSGVRVLGWAWCASLGAVLVVSLAGGPADASGCGFGLMLLSGGLLLSSLRGAV